MKTPLQYIIKRIEFFLPMLILLALLFKNPFSDRNLIGNFEPFPDSFHYITTPRCFLAGEGWNLCREGRTIESSVPPAYSILLLPFLALSSDPRVFYFANIALSLLSLFLLYKILARLKIHKLTTVTILTTYATNYYTYWFPSLAMAENLIIPLSLLSILFFFLPMNKKNSFLAAVTFIAIFETKYAALPIFAVFSFAYFIKIFNNKKSSKKSSLQYFYLTLFPLILILEPSKTLSMFSSMFSFLTQLFVKSPSPSPATIPSWVFSKDFFSVNFPQYLRVFNSENIRFLWDFTPLVPKWVISTGVFGLVLSLIDKKSRKLSLMLVTLMFAQIIFMSFFYAVDTRYIYIVLPIMLIGSAMGMQHLLHHRWAHIKVIVPILLVFQIFSVAPQLKLQLALNLKYSETPWWYVASGNLNDFSSNISNDKTAYITAIPPYLLDYYVAQDIAFLPLTKTHDFSNNREALYGYHDYTSLPDLYEEYIAKGYTLFVASYGLGNVQERRDDFQLIQDNFTLTLLEEGCHGACNIYKLGSSPPN